MEIKLSPPPPSPQIRSFINSECSPPSLNAANQPVVYEVLPWLVGPGVSELDQSLCYMEAGAVGMGDE